MVTNTNTKIPISIKIPIILIGIIAFIFILYMAKGIIIPLVFATIIAIVLHPVVNLLIKIKVNRILAIIITLFLTFLVIASIGAIAFSQIGKFTESFPKLVDKFSEILNQTIVWISGHFNLSNREITAWILKTKNELISSLQIGQTIASLSSVLVFLFLIPVYIFMLLFYRPLIIEFLRRVFGADHRSKVSEVINLTKTLIHRYLIGLMLQVAIIATMYTIGLLLLGIEYAIILGVIGAFLNLIPYLGSIIAALMPMIIAVVTKTSPWFALLVLALYVLTQFIDNNFITPKIVGSQVKLNALATLIAVIGFAALWGIPGMVVAIPITAITKLIFDHVESLKHWGFLLGDTMPQKKMINPILKKIVRK
ncbi:MAG: AI-2E family transporter [Tenuifilaceae bacterium]|nr:AI-2E family transporter [Tenuifilaceae bacterium]